MANKKGQAQIVFLVIIIAIFYFINQSLQEETKEPIVNIELTQNGCNPVDFAIKSGTKVTWTNIDNEDVILSLDRSGIRLNGGESFSKVFVEKQQVSYRCGSKIASIRVE